MIKIRSNGSTVIIVIFVLTALLVSITTVWRSTTYMLDLSTKRILHEQRLRCTEGLLHLIIAMAKENYDDCMKLKKPLVQSIAQWSNESGTSKKHEGAYSIEPHEDGGLLLKAELLLHKKILCSLQCQLEHTKINNRMQYLVSSWKINEVV